MAQTKLDINQKAQFRLIKSVFNHKFRTPNYITKHYKHDEQSYTSILQYKTYQIRKYIPVSHLKSADLNRIQKTNYGKMNNEMTVQI